LLQVTRRQTTFCSAPYVTDTYHMKGRWKFMKERGKQPVT